MTKHFISSRRDFLKSGGALVVGFSFAGQPIAAFAEESTASKPLALTSVDTFLAIDSASKVTVYSGKVDLGTGENPVSDREFVGLDAQACRRKLV